MTVGISLKELIYRKSPAFAQNLLVTAEGLSLDWKRYGNKFSVRLSRIDKQKKFSENELENFQRESLKELLSHAQKTEIYKGLDVKSILTQYDTDNHLDIDITTKAEVRDSVQNYINSDIGCYIKLVTSGSSGIPLSVEFNKQAYQDEYAFFWSRNRHRVSRSDKFATFNARMVVPDISKAKKFWRQNYASNQLLFSQFHLSKSTIRKYVNRFNSFEPIYVQGYPSFISEFCNLVRSEGLPIKKVKYIFTGSESLHQWQRCLVEDVLGGKIYDLYGQVEKAALITQCQYGAYHINEDYSLVELIPNGGHTYKVIATPFLNKRQIMLRYDTGDIVIGPIKRGCKCGQGR